MDNYPERWHVSGAQARVSCGSLFKQLEILHIQCQYMLSLINSIINNQENFKQIKLYTILIKGINTIFID